MADLHQKAINVVKSLIMDGTRKANSGHPGGAMSSADMVYTLFKDFLKYDPQNPNWFNRDRFILGAGHESMLLYSMLTLQGFLDKKELEGFRQLNTLTPGHPEYHRTPGVEATTGPLGQGFTMAVGIAAAEQYLGSQLGEDIVDHYTYVLSGDGDMQEPIVMGAAALAGHWGLDKLVVFYDSNNAQIAGKRERADSTNYPEVFTGFGWNVIQIDGHNFEEIRNAVKSAKEQSGKPTIIVATTIMAKGTATMEGDHETHGAPLPPEEIAGTKEKFGLNPEEFFQLPEDILNDFHSKDAGLTEKVNEWNDKLNQKLNADTEFAALWNELQNGADLDSVEVPQFTPGESIATRGVFGKNLVAYADKVKTLIGGSADLDPSNSTTAYVKKFGDFTKTNRAGRNLPYGVREFPMAAISNGIALHGLKAFAATFMVFSDYARHAIRLSAMQKLPVIYEFTHDSFYVGEDGPTHQPVEHLAALRVIPNLLVLRPADAFETNACVRIAMEQKTRPSAIALTRQNLPIMETDNKSALEGVRKGAYIVHGSSEEKPEIVIIAAGSEVSLAIETAKALSQYKVRVVSMPSMELFEEQSAEYKESVIPSDVEYRVAVEAGVTFGWHKYTGSKGWVYGMTDFAKSGPYKVLADYFGFTVEKFAPKVEAKYKEYLNSK